ASEGRAPAASLLRYPVLHPLQPEPNAEEAAALQATPLPLRFSRETMHVMSANYTGRPLAQAVPHEFPGLAAAEQLAALPRTYLEADEFDDLRVGARRYAEQLQEAGVEVEHVVRRGAAHGHLNQVGLPAARESMDRMAEILRALRLLAAPVAPAPSSAGQAPRPIRRRPPASTAPSPRWPPCPPGG